MIYYNNIDSKYIIKEKRKVSNWIKSCITEEGKIIDNISFNLCSDEYILQLNNEALQHDYYTDIITFELNEKDKPIEGDIYISIDRVKDNAITLHIPFMNELHRVLIHGVLHLCGYKDKSKKEELLMREKENYYLNKL
jgi:probable rRNA maturation factor